MLYDLKQLPMGCVANKVEVSAAVKDGRSTQRVTLDSASRAGKWGVDFVDQPSFVLLPDLLTDGVIEVDLCGQLLQDAPDFARGFIGLAYRVQDDLATYESVYLRPANGRGNQPPPPRDQRAVQYYAYPDWLFDRLRDEEPAQYEAAADVVLGQWHRLRLEIAGAHFAAFVDGVLVLQGDGKLAPQAGRIGLWVDIGTDGYFANLRITSAV